MWTYFKIHYSLCSFQHIHTFISSLWRSLPTYFTFTCIFSNTAYGLSDYICKITFSLCLSSTTTRDIVTILSRPMRFQFIKTIICYPMIQDECINDSSFLWSSFPISAVLIEVRGDCVWWHYYSSPLIMQNI